LTIGAWYFTNGMNGIAMQSFSRFLSEQQQAQAQAQPQQQQQQQQQMTTTSTRSFCATVAITSVVTSLQLLLGAILGWFMLLLYRYSTKATSTKEPPRSKILTFHAGERTLALLHGVGSICTDLGFMYGSASLVQTLKLLEPFETLVLTKLLLPGGEEGNKLTLGVMSSCLLTVGSAISLLNSSSSTEPHPHAIMFAIASGLSLSSRNVLQRRQHLGGKLAATNMPTTAETNLQSPQMTSKLERSLFQFTQLSLQSGTVMALISILLHSFLLCTDKNHGATLTDVLSEAMNWRLLTWHPLYNAFSMITLGFCSALTHSLLNAGKRVFAICLAIVWFQEGYGWATIVSLAAVTVGACWYAMEVKTAGRVVSSSSWTTRTKPLASLMLLILVYAVVRLESIIK
jgi:hypothetical protein